MPRHSPGDRGAVSPLDFHTFLGAHSLLIGLLPFYLPVWLWRQGMDLAGLSLLIGVSGLAFAAALGAWTRFASERTISALVTAGLVLELVLTGLAWGLGPRTVAAAPVVCALLLGIASGAYNAFFWTTQRVLFARTISAGEAGRRYGNFQIFVAVLLKVGIVVGGLVLDAGGLGWLFLLSVGISFATALRLSRRLPPEPLLSAAELAEAPGWHSSLVQRDKLGARPAFMIDGVFLLLESHFWTVSLFLVFDEDFTNLGVLVVVLGIVFAALFWLSKNSIDRLAPTALFRSAVALYALSWGLRALLDEASATAWLAPLLVAITFCTSFFRLVLNKRLFEHASFAGITPYLLWKSRLSQTALGICFIGIALALTLGTGPAADALETSYLAAAALSLVYLLYRPAPARAHPPGSLANPGTVTPDDRRNAAHRQNRVARP